LTRLIWIYAPADGDTLLLAEHDTADGHEGGIVHVAESRELATTWARQLRLGELPHSSEPAD